MVPNAEKKAQKEHSEGKKNTGTKRMNTSSHPSGSQGYVLIRGHLTWEKEKGTLCMFQN